MQELQDLSAYLDGNGTPYHPVLKAIRDFLKHFPEVKESKGGAIIFFEKRSDANDLVMKVFPFKQDLPLFADKEKVPDHVLFRILRKINEEKYYSEFWHFNHFREHYKGQTHFFKSVPPDDVLHYDNFKKEDWEQFAQDMENDLIPKNKYEQVLFRSGCSEVCLVPLPILSTPSIIIVLERKCVNKGRDNFFHHLYFHAREAISKYLDIRLVSSVMEFIREQGGKTTENEFLREFVNQLCHVYLPISYTINDGPEVPYYDKWPMSTPESWYTLNLLDKYKVKFRLTSFAYMNLEGTPDSDSVYPLIHTCDIYAAINSQSKSFVELIFVLLHYSWQQARTIGEQVKVELEKSIEILTQGAGHMLKDYFYDWLKVSREAKTEIVDRGIPDNIFRIDYDPARGAGNVYLRVKGKEIIDHTYPANGRGNNKLSGFIYLKTIIELMQNGDGKSKFITAQELYDTVITPKRINMEKSPVAGDDCLNGHETVVASNKRQTVMADRQIVGEVQIICNGIHSFLATYKTENITVANYPHIYAHNSDFKQSLVYWFKVLTILRLKNVRITNETMPELKTSFVRTALLEFKTILDLAHMVKKSDEDAWNALYKATEVGAHIDPITEALQVKDGCGEKKGVKQQAIKDCISACIKEITDHKNVSHIRPFIELLMDNLHSAGLIKKATCDPVQSNRYKYVQAQCTDPLVWSFE